MRVPGHSNFFPSSISQNISPYKSAPFHDDFFDDFEGLVTGRLKEAAWLAYRESAKTSITKIGIAWIIARKQVIDALRKQGEEVSHWGERLYINIDSYDKANAESVLFDVVTELQTNQLLISDFGHLYTSLGRKMKRALSAYQTSSPPTVSA
jgi:hypothetical protein